MDHALLATGTCRAVWREPVCASNLNDFCTLSVSSCVREAERMGGDDGVDNAQRDSRSDTPRPSSLDAATFLDAALGYYSVLERPRLGVRTPQLGEDDYDQVRHSALAALGVDVHGAYSTRVKYEHSEGRSEGHDLPDQSWKLEGFTGYVTA